MFGRRTNPNCLAGSSYKACKPASTRQRITLRCRFAGIASASGVNPPRSSVNLAAATSAARVSLGLFPRLSLSSYSYSYSLPILPVVAPRTPKVMAARHLSSSTPRAREKQKAPVASSDDEHHEHASLSVANSNSHSHSHSHSHSIFGHSHANNDGPDHHHQEVESILAALKGRGDRGSRITLLGLVVNVGLTGVKGLAGWYMNSAALLAEAGHSASDLLGDCVTLFAWRFSRRPPTLTYPYGFGKFETLGTTTVALILIGGAVGIGAHSCTLLSHHLLETAATLPPGPAQVLVQNVTEVAQSVASAVPSIHAHGGLEHIVGEEFALDPNAAWFALASVVLKEWLYRLTRRVALTESSGVLLANAIHHRADAYTSAVALLAILGSWAFPAIPLDPLGGLLVALVILKQGCGLFWESVGELTDRGVKVGTRRALQEALVSLVEEEENGLGPVKDIEELRAMRAGALLSVDVKVRVPGALTVDEAGRVEERIRSVLREVRKEIGEVRVKFVPVDERSEEKVEDELDHEHEHGHEHGHGHEHAEKMTNGRAR